MIQAVELFAVGVGFYLLLGVLSLILTVFMETKHPSFAGVCMAGVFWYLWWTKKFDIVAYAMGHPFAMLGWIAAWCVIGAASLWPKWYGFVSDDLEVQADRVSKYPTAGHKYEAPKVSDHKEQLIAWAIYWPWSMFWFLVRHPLRRVGTFIYDSMGESLSKMSESMTKRAIKRHAERFSK